MKETLFLLLTVTGLFLISCTKENDTPEKNLTVNGLIQKGPFIQGATITILELDENFQQTGKTFITNTFNDQGAFSTDVTLISNNVQIIANGFYYNEVIGEISESNISLKALVNLSTNTDININILTSLINDRILYLINNENLNYQSAKQQAEEELLGALNLNNNQLDFENMDLVESSILLGLSSIFQGHLTTGSLSELIAHVNFDLRNDGNIDDQNSINQLRVNASGLVQKDISDNLIMRYSNLGISIDIPAFQEVIEQFINSHLITLNVPNDFSTIQQAIDNSHEGDTILVEPGIYFENLTIQNHNIVLTSRYIENNDSAYINSTIVDGQGNDTVISLINRDSTCQIIGFTVRNGGDYGCSLNKNGTFISLNITENNNGGLYLTGSSYISDCSISNNGGPIKSLGDFDKKVTFYKTFIVKNFSNDVSALFMNGIDNVVNFINVTVADNTTTSNSSSIHLGNISCRLNISNSIIWNMNDNEIFHYSNEDVKVNYSNIYGQVFDGEGNINIDPSFVDPVNGDYNLLSNSPCIDSGNPDIIYNDSDGSRNDIGATGNVSN